MSYRLTFSLASLIVLIAFGLVFAPAAVIADPGGSTVEIALYDGKVASADPNAAPATDDASGAVDYTATRANFIVTLTFSKPVAAGTGDGQLDTDDISVRRAASASATAIPITGSVLTVYPGSTDNTKYTLQINMADTLYESSILLVSLPEDAVNDTTISPLGNQASTGGRFESLPKATDGTASLELDASTYDPAVDIVGANFADSTVTGAGFAVKIDITGATGTVPDPDATQVRVVNADGNNLTDTTANPTNNVAVTISGTTPNFIATLAFTGTVPHPVTISLNPEWADSGEATVTVPEQNEISFPTATPTTLSVNEGTAADMNIGAPVTATDTLGHPLTYILGGTDATSFDIDSATGQLKTKTALDYATKSSYAVTVTAAHEGVSASIDVTINVIEVVNPTVDISLVSHDPAAKTINVKFEFAEAVPTGTQVVVPIPTVLTAANISIMKAGMVPVSITLPTVTQLTISGQWIADIDYSLDDSLPLDIGLTTDVMVSATTINGSPPATGAPAVLTIEAPDTVPGAPTAVSATANADNTITISWTAPTDDGGDAITGYTVTKQYTGADGAAATKDFSATASPHTIPPTGSTEMLARGLEFTFTVKATNSVGTGPASVASTAVSIDPTVPGMPTAVSATANADNTITISWTAPTDNGGAAITGYAITQMQSGQVDTIYSGIAADVTSHTTGALAAGDYSFTVMATNSVGTGSASSPAATATILPPPTAPGMPTAVSATANADNTITISWTAPTDDGGAAITGYTVTKQYMEDGTAATKDFSATASPLTIPPTGSTDMLARGVDFTFIVKATNSVGTGPESAASTAVSINPTAPDAPTAVSATADQDANTITISWTAPTDNGGAAITGYAITQTGQAGMTYTAAATATSHTTGALAAGDYSFTVMATNSVGDSVASSPAATAMIEAAPTTPAIAQPANVMVGLSADNLSFVVSWDPPADRTGIMGYYVSYNPTAHVSGAATDEYNIGTDKPTDISVWSTEDTIADPAATPPPDAVMVDLTRLDDLAPAAPGAGSHVKNPVAKTVTLTWPSVATAGSYTVMRVGASDPVASGIMTLSHTIQFGEPDANGQLPAGIDQALPAKDTTYTYYVVAVNAAGDSPSSNHIVVVVEGSGSPLDFTDRALSGQPLPAYTVGTESQSNITLSQAENGTPPYVYTLWKGVGAVVPVPTSPDGKMIDLGNGLTIDLSSFILAGTPTQESSRTMYTWRVTDSAGAFSDLAFYITVNPETVIPPTNTPPVVSITTTPPTAGQTGSFAIAYTVTDDNVGGMPTVAATHTPSPPTATGYTLEHDATAKMVTITQAPGSPIAVVTVTITAIDAGGLTHSQNISVPFAARAATPVDTTPPTVEITIAPAPTGPDVHADTLRVTLDFNEPVDPGTIEIGRAGNTPVLQISDPVVDTADNTIYTVDILSEDYRTRAETKVLLKRGVKDAAGNATGTDLVGTYKPPGPPTPTNPTLTIEAVGYTTPNVVARNVVGNMTPPNVVGLNCLDGNRLTFTSDIALGSDEEVVASEVSVTAPANSGWGIKTDSRGYIMVYPLPGRDRLNVTEITVTVEAGAVKSANGAPSKEAVMKFTVGPVLTIPAGGYIVVVRTNAQRRTHLTDVHTLHVGDPHVGAATVSVQTWDCMPDLGILFGRANYNYDRGGTLIVKGGGGLIVKASPEDAGEKNANIAKIVKGRVGISEIMWAIDRSDFFGVSRNYEHAREQWIELHNLENREVKVTLFDLELGEAYSSVDYGEVDRMSNFNLPHHHGPWNIRDADRGQDGDSDYGEDFVAMQRGPANAGKNYVHGDFDGRNGSKWKKATAVYLTRSAGFAHTGQLDVNNLNYDFIGTPGRSNNIGPSGPPQTTTVPLKPFVFNEVGNRTNRLYDWIELRNTSGAEANLRNYQISIVTGVGSDDVLFTFPNSDIKLAKDELILILATDPEDDGEHPIAVGYDVLGGNDQAPGVNANSAKYIVANRNERFYTEGLPASNFVLLLRRSEAHDKRNAHAKLKTHEWIIDVAGYHNNLGDRNASPKYTALWPLNGHGAPFSKNDLKEEGVYFRRDPGRLHGENNNDKPAFVRKNYTGIGYRRHAQNVSEHGGTPGYHDIRKSLVAQVTAGHVTVSEIMFDQGDGRYPQWIELYNSSATEAVNLHSEAGWRLIINNYDDRDIPLARVSGTLNFKNSEVQTILPQQTVLVTSTRARSAGSATTNASIVFIPTRVFSVWTEARDQLGMTRSTDPILSEEGFTIELIDGKGNTSDKVGNLIQSRGRVIDTLDWSWADINAEPMEDQPRSSILRRYREPEMDVNPINWKPYSVTDILSMGIKAEGWVAARDTGFRQVHKTFYGHRDDYGTPGVTGGRVLPVSLSKFRPERLATGEVVVRWITESELNNAGFNILRSDAKDGEFTKLNTKLIAGKGTTSERTVYEFTDTSAKPNVIYYYQIQDVSFDGAVTTLRTTHLRGNVTPAGKATTTWGELKALQ